VSLEEGPVTAQLADVHEVAGRVVDELLELGAAELAPIGGGPSGGDPLGSAS
jgi:hydroxymethylbilane synthase